VSVLAGAQSRVVVQGITGNEGNFHTGQMLAYGTPIVAGVTPGKGGQEVHGVPVYGTVKETVSEQGADTSIIFVPPRFVRDAVLEAIEAKIKTIIIITELVPLKDAIEFILLAVKKGVTVLGPNCPGMINPASRTHIGVMPVHVFSPGKIGIISRSGTLSYEIAWQITAAGLGQSTSIGIGGDPVIGLDYIGTLDKFKEDDETEAVVLIGEIGGNAEELAADYIRDSGFPKPVAAFVAGRTAPPEKRMGHAGAIISGGAGTATG